MSATSGPAGGDAPYRGARANGWIAFAAIMLMIIGAFGVFYGLVAILNDQQVAQVGSGHGVVVFDVTTWGWITLVIGAVQILTGFGLYSASNVARVIAIIFAAFSALAQFGIVTAFPLWAILIIALDFVVIYQLAVNWEEKVAPLR
jgi:hypothetical protein